MYRDRKGGNTMFRIPVRWEKAGTTSGGLNLLSYVGMNIVVWAQLPISSSFACEDGIAGLFTSAKLPPMVEVEALSVEGGNGSEGICDGEDMSEVGPASLLSDSLDGVFTYIGHPSKVAGIRGRWTGIRPWSGNRLIRYENTSKDRANTHTLSANLQTWKPALPTSILNWYDALSCCIYENLKRLTSSMTYKPS